MILDLVRGLLMGLLFWIIISSSVLCFLPFHLLRFLQKPRKAYDYITKFSQIIGRLMIFCAGCRLAIEGRENIPVGKSYCFISNHQAYMDILLFMAACFETPGYIAKKTLSRVPWISSWMRAYGCYFLERNSLRDGMKAILFGAERIKNRYPMVIFPEGTRSKSSKMGEWRKGSLKLASKAKSLIVPVSIEGTYNTYEAKGYATPSWVAIRFHPCVDVSQLSSEQEQRLSDTLYYTIQKGVLELKAKTPYPFR